MSADRSPAPEIRRPPECFWEPPGGFTPWLAAIGGCASGVWIFLRGFRLVCAQTGPGVVACGNCFWGGLFAMVVLAPLAAMVMAVGGGGIGFLLDEIQSHRRRASIRERLHSCRERAPIADRRMSTD